jgi:micrococcal nuclease
MHEERKMYEYKAKVTNVVDGDTVDALVDLGFKVQTLQRLRLSRVDTPERTQSGYAAARDFVKELIEGKDVTMRSHKASKWGYFLIDISIDGRDVADMLLTAGLAKAYDGGKK